MLKKVVKFEDFISASALILKCFQNEIALPSVTLNLKIPL